MTVPSRLSSLLVRDGLVGPGSLEHVFQHQVLHGGALDTVLLEMQLVDESSLERYLSLATGLPLADGTQASDEAKRLCSREVADKYAVVPVSVSDQALSVLVCDPVSVDNLEGLADELHVTVHPMVVPEYQYRLALAECYGETPDTRFARLAMEVRPSNGTKEHVMTFGERLARAAMEEASSIPHKITPESTSPADTTERIRGTRAKAEPPKRRQTLEMDTAALRQHANATQALAAEAPKVVADDSQRASGMHEAFNTTTATFTPEQVPSVPSAAVAKKNAELPPGNAPLTPEQARVALGTAEERDEIFAALLRAVRNKTDVAVLLTVKGKTATGKIALVDDDLDQEAVSNIQIPLDVPSPFLTVMGTKTFSLTSLATDNPALAGTFQSLGYGEKPPATALLLPIVLRDRVIAIAVGHNRERELSMADVAELLPLANATTDAVSRMLAAMRAKKGAVEIKTADASEQSSASTEKTTLAEAGGMDELFERLEGQDDAARKGAFEEALSHPKEVLAYLSEHFPGKLFVERDDTKDRLNAAAHGPVLDLVVQLGTVSGPLLAEKMRDASREVRYYATVCAAEIRPPEVINELVERLLDGDTRIRELAIDALAGYPIREREGALDFARRALHSEDNLRLKLAAEGLVKLGDTRAIADLVDAHSRGGEAAEISEKALFELTCQGFGGSTRKWRNWWNKNQTRGRVEWMLEGLADSSPEIRKHAVDTLRELTGEHFGYEHDLPKKERDKKRKEWWSWWDESGKDRFS